MRAVLFSLGFLLLVVNAQDCGRLDIVVILDNSGSVESVFEREKSLALDLTGGIPIQIGGSQVGIVTFASDANVVLPIYPPKDREAVLAALSGIKHRGGSTNVVDSFVKAKALFAKSTAPTKIIVIVTDGNSQNKWGAIASTCKGVRDAGIVIYATTQSDDPSEKELRLYTGDEKKVFQKDKVAALRKILTELAGPGCPKPGTTTPKPKPTTTPKRTTPRKPKKTTTPRPTPKKTTTPKPTPKTTTPLKLEPRGGCDADILFVIDTSGSVLKDFRDEVVFSEQIVKNLDLGEKGNHKVAVIEYSAYHKQKLFIPFGKYQSSRDELVGKIDNMEYYGGTTYTARALELAKKSITEGRRPGKNLLVILVHDGISYDDPEPIGKQIRQLQNVDVIGVGVNKLVIKDTLVKVAGDASRVFVGEDPVAVARQVLNAIGGYTNCGGGPARRLDTEPITKPNVQKVTTTTTARRTTPKKTTPAATTPPTTTVEPGPGHCKFDVLIVMDSSGSVKGEIFKHEIDRAVRIVRRLDFTGRSGARVGFIKFAGPGTASTEFPLNKYKNANDVEDAIRNTKFISGTTAAGDALRLAARELAPARGARPGEAEQVVIVVTDGLSQQPVEAAAKQLQAKAKYVYSLATDRFYGPDQLKAIASGPNSWFHTNTPGEKERFEKAMDVLTEKCKP